ncbi:MAG TPA: hypothetical protein VH561_08680 [Micromonosporaceae bacterium]|jgi:hypothetical protein
MTLPLHRWRLWCVGRAGTTPWGRGTVAGVVLVMALTGCSGTPPAGSTATPSAASCLPSGTEAEINAALQGTGAVVELCPGAVFTLHGPVTFSAPQQVLRTRGIPAGDDRALLRVDSAGLTTAINGKGRSGIVIEHIRVDGGRARLGALAGDALLELGGDATGQTVRQVAAGDTRSWSTLHLGEGAIAAGRAGCQGATVTDSTFGPAGDPGGDWADGISLACQNSTVRHNVVQDATDGAIVVFGAAGSTIADNTVVAVSRALLGGINMVDYAPFDGDYQGTTVTGNVIDGQGALIRVGIAMGPQVWTCKPGTNFGATVTDNVVKGDHVAYSFPVNGVRDWTVRDNVDRAHHTALPGSGCGGLPSSPGGFQYQTVSSSSLQPGYAKADLTYVLGAYEPGSPPTGCGVMNAEQPLRSGRSISSCDGRFTLAVEPSGTVVLAAGKTVVWSAPLSSHRAATVEVKANGDLVALDASSRVVWSTGTSGHPLSRLALQDDGNLVLYDPADHVLWATNTSV